MRQQRLSTMSGSQSLGFECSPGTQPQLSSLPWPWVTTGSGQNISPNVQSLRFRGGRLRLFGWRRLLATLAGGRSLPNVKELTGGCSNMLVYSVRVNILWGFAHVTRSLSTRRDTLTSFDLDSYCACSCSSCCGASPPTLSLATLGEQIGTIFFMSTHENQWFCAKCYLILGS